MKEYKPSMVPDIRCAWAFWYVANFGFSGALNGGWSYYKSYRHVLPGKREFFDSFDYRRLQEVEIENKDALKLFKFWDGEDTFWYCDPPYIDKNQGHYFGYTRDEYSALLSQLGEIKGKFILSSYTNDLLTEAISRYGWVEKKMSVYCHAANTVRGRRVEVLVMNYAEPI